ncbi:MAG: hypothetical protein EXS38_02685 [Opitutus sp.]|nr:hypothetical protein [Opitutus sp.]
MAEELRAIIADLADRADEFPKDGRDRAHARAGIAELLTMDFPYLNPGDRAVVVAGVIRLLEEEDFFGTEFVGYPFADHDEESDA